MIIVHQDKDKIINFDNVFGLDVEVWTSEDYVTEPDCYFIRAEKAQDICEYEFLGEYKTKERAKEVLQEIVKDYK